MSLRLREKSPKKKRLEENKKGKNRLDKILSNLANRIQRGDIGVTIGSKKGIIGSYMSSLQVDKTNGVLQFNVSPHLHLDDEDEFHDNNFNRWEISS